MANEQVHEIPIANVARVEVVTEEEAAKTYVVETSDEITLEAFVSEGEEKELRKLNRLISQLRTEDIIKGYDITMKDLVLHPFVMALVDGGQSTVSEDGSFTYDGPTMGDVVKRTPFTVNIYTEEKDGACDPEIYAAMGNLKPLRDLLNSFRNKTSINQSYANGIILNHDFSNDTNTLACFICGHGHKDQSHEENGVLTIATAADYRSGDDTVTREFGTVTEQAIDVFTINTQDRTIKTVRVGGGEDREWTY